MHPDLSGVLLHDAHLPESILIILPPEQVGRAARKIARLYFLAEQDLPVILTKAVVEFVILIWSLLLVERSDFVENLPAPCAHVDRIDPFFAVGIMESRGAHTKSRAGRQRDSLLKIALPNSVHAAADIVGAASL